MEFNDNFLLEVYKQCLESKYFVEALKPHFNYGLAPSKHYKDIFKFLFDHFTVYSHPPTFGTLTQKFKEDDNKLALLAKIKDVDIQDREEALMIETEKYIRRGLITLLTHDMREMYETGKQDEVGQFAEKRLNEINAINLRARKFKWVLRDYVKRHENRMDIAGNPDLKNTFLTFIPGIDFITGYNLEAGDSMLCLTKPGGGKTTALRWFGYAFSMQGYNSVHFQTDAKTGETETIYDAIFSGTPRWKTKNGNLLSDSDLDRMHKAWEFARENFGDIAVVDYNFFDEPTVADARKQFNEIDRDGETIHAGIFDYMDMFGPGDGVRYGGGDGEKRNKLYQTAEKIVALGQESERLMVTAKQTHNIPDKFYNDPANFIGSEHIGESKIIERPFSFGFSINQTDDEFEKNMMRMRMFKYRSLGPGVTLDHLRFPIATDFDSGRLINVQETKRKFWDDNKKMPLF